VPILPAPGHSRRPLVAEPQPPGGLHGDPLAGQEEVTVTIPDYGKVQIDAPRAGAFYVVSEKGGGVSEIEAP